jgi:peptidoglycan/LPS O-acetylase OafA/YrhL
MPARLANVDALRGAAALWVFAYHLWNVFAPGYSPQGCPADHKPFDADTPVGVIASYPLCAYGYTGVGLFFVLSGFCIHLPQARKHHSKGTDALEPRAFFYRRLRRLYPAYFASLFLALAGLMAMTATMSGATPMPLETAAVYVLVNAFFLLAVNPNALGLNGVYWTLWYEVQFYLAYPLLLKVCRRVGFGGVAVGLLAVELLFTFVPTPEVLKPLAPHFEWFFLRRLLEWFLGMWLAERVAQGLHLPRWGSLGIAVTAAAGGVIASHVPAVWAGHELLLAVASAGVLSLLVSPATGEVRGVLAWPGNWSYSLYLIHMPVLRLIFTGEALVPESWRYAGSFYWAGAAAAVLVPATAWVWYRLFEKPFLPKPAVGTPAVAVA